MFVTSQGPWMIEATLPLMNASSMWAYASGVVSALCRPLPENRLSQVPNAFLAAGVSMVTFLAAASTVSLPSPYRNGWP